MNCLMMFLSVLKNLNAVFLRGVLFLEFWLTIFVLGIFWAKLGQDLCMSNCAMINESHPGCNHDHQKTRFSFLKVWIFRAKASPSSILGPSRLSLINFRGAPKLWTPAVLFHRSQNHPKQPGWLVWCPFLSSFNAIRTNGNSPMNFDDFPKHQKSDLFEDRELWIFFLWVLQGITRWFNGPGFFRVHAKTQLNRCIKTCCKQIRFFDGQELAHNPHLATFPPAVSDQPKRPHHL